jgi:ketosteroid isomerase-like protein
MQLMKPILLAVALLGCTFLTSAQEKKTSNSVEAAVLNAEQRWEEALTKADAAALENLYDDTLVYTHSNGKVDNKSSYISAIKAGATKYESMKRDDIKVNVYGDAAVVTCHWEVHIASNGNKVDMNARYLHVYIRHKDGWKLVAHESTRIS